MDLRELDRRVLAVTTGIVGQVRVDQLDAPTPCTGWTLGDLLRHMVGNNNGFAAAALGEAPVAGVWDGVDVVDPIGESWPPDSPAIWGPDAAFGFRVEVPAGAPAADRMPGLLGRSPAWPH
ncbi:MAG: hypothetical protein GEV28_17515 [Actinophytocola sp.]|uniref:maleylpyruvate isomerase N-terminal domain-containing protein n=1 Tax=Actinophytocola sp. TaxID=1872138 RepID=UPI0013223E13|nr:maleylpyruvate isomerase N-terminal domain-containing protein [Actinophytocola sp.]MPZ82088.1 hypothetical protein [Actinophytocola sp.]